MEQLIKKLRIAVDARPLRHPHSGIGRYTKAISTRLEQLGHTLIYCDAAGNPLRQTIVSQLQFGAVARRAEADLFWSPRHHLPLGLKGLPSVVTIHDLVWQKAPNTMPRARRWLDGFLMRSALTKADHIIAVSFSTKRDLIALRPNLANRVTVIPEAPMVTPEDYESTGVSSVEQPYVLFVGTLEPRKNLSRLVDAFLKSDLPRHQLVVAGQPGWGNITLPNSKRIRWVMPRSDDELCSLYEHAEFVAAPSLYEGFGLQIAEALAFGKAVITSTRASMPEVAGDAAVYIDPLRTEQIISALNQLGKDAAARTKLERAAKSQAARFSWDVACDQTLAVFTAAAKKRD